MGGTVPDMIQCLRAGKNLNQGQINCLASEILAGNTTHEQNVDFLACLTEKGETDEELLGILEKMQELAVRLDCDDGVIDMCGTGGDKSGTFNVSTAASFVVAAAGGKVAKHGNYSTGVSGSADIFEYFGYDLYQDPGSISDILRRHNICFMFAQHFHPAMRYLGPARRQLKKRTVFNLLGPLSNPARVKNQLIGVSSARYLDRLPKILQKRGAQRVMTVHSGGMDEFSTIHENEIVLLADGEMTRQVIDPQSLGLQRSQIRDIQVETKQQAIDAFVGVISGTANKAMIETCALNAGGGLVVSGKTSDLKEAVHMALDAISGGTALGLFERFVADTGDASRLEGLVR